MSAIDLAATMDAIADTLVVENVTDRAFAWPVQQVQPPCAVVGYPTRMEFDSTFRRGSDLAVFPVWIVVGLVHDRSARDVLSAYLTGVTGVKDALDGDLGGVVQTARVTDCQVETVTIGGTEYLSARFSVECYT